MTQNDSASDLDRTTPLPVFIVWKNIFWVLVSAALLGYLLLGMSSVPFHPDESTWIFMSSDWDRMLSVGPSSVAWSPSRELDPLQVERENAGPFTRDVIGITRALFGVEATSVDWNWRLSWAANEQAGALPDPALLWIARLPLTLCFWLTILLLARCAGYLAGNLGALATAIAFGVNAQALLHLRHAMSESSLLFGMALVALAVIELIRRGTRPKMWSVLLGIALAIAISAKISGLLMLPVAFAGILLATSGQPFSKLLRRFGILSGITFLAGLLSFALLNPFYWSNPLEAANAVIEARTSIQTRQTQAMEIAGPGLVMTSIPVRLLALTYEAFFASPAYWDIPNYKEETKAAEVSYAQSIWSGSPAGIFFKAVWFLTVLVGFFVVVLKLRTEKERNLYLVVLIWGGCIGMGILLGVTILWQRYYILQVPVLSIYAGVGFVWLISRFKTRAEKKTNHLP